MEESDSAHSQYAGTHGTCHVHTSGFHTHCTPLSPSHIVHTHTCCLCSPRQNTRYNTCSSAMPPANTCWLCDAWRRAAQRHPYPATDHHSKHQTYTAAAASGHLAAELSPPLTTPPLPPGAPGAHAATTWHPRRPHSPLSSGCPPYGAAPPSAHSPCSHGPPPPRHRSRCGHQHPCG